MKDNNVYRKEGRRYKPIGVLCPHDDYLSDGIWIVSHKEGSYSLTRGDYLASSYGLIKVGEIAKIELNKIAAMEDYASVASKILSEKRYESICHIDLARLIVKELFEFQDGKKDKDIF